MHPALNLEPDYTNLISTIKYTTVQYKTKLDSTTL